jgi:hypothetical protein
MHGLGQATPPAPGPAAGLGGGGDAANGDARPPGLDSPFTRSCADRSTVPDISSSEAVCRTNGLMLEASPLVRQVVAM